MSASRIRDDFDRIVALDDGANPNDLYHASLLRHLPQPCHTILEVGCGTGTLTRQLAARADRVIAVDLSARMIERARLECLGHEHIEFHAARDWLRPDGQLLVLDLLRADSLADHLRSLIALPVSAALRLRRTGRLRPPRELRAAWHEHGQHDEYLSFTEAREIYDRVLPGAQVRRRLLWRYEVRWEKPNY